ncbi:hypothetical protein HF072_04925 [Bacillus sp. RO3]|nr:hypothetical protein [Bacillus sp. RO3]
MRKVLIILTSLLLVAGLSFDNEEYHENVNNETITPNNEKHPPPVL